MTGDLDHVDQSQLSRTAAIIDSMTPGERRRPVVINDSRRKRIARGSGTTVEEVNRLLKQFTQMRKMLKDGQGDEPKGQETPLPRAAGRRRVRSDAALIPEDVDGAA